MKWVTRSFPHVDRTVCAWLIKRFIDPDAEFVFINWPEEELKPEYGMPFDIKGVKYGHRDNKCSFEVMIEEFKISDPYVKKIAEIVHAADIKGEIDKVPEARGIKALMSGLRLITKDDYGTLELGMKIWDALYAYFRSLDIEKEYEDELAQLSKTERLGFIKSLIDSKNP